MLSTDRLQHDLLEALERDQLVLPTLPEIALQVQQAANDPDTDIPRLQAVLANDAALSARVVRVANSPLVRGYHAIDNLPAALSRLGVTYSCNLAMGLAMEQMFQATNEHIDSRLREIWSSCSEVAAIAAVLAQHYSNLEPDQAALAGLTHRIGVLPILAYAEEQGGEPSDQGLAALDKAIIELGPSIGEKILQTWNFPDSLTIVPIEHLDLQRDSAALDFADIVQVARLQSYGFASEQEDVPEWNTIPAFTKLGLNAGGDLTESMELEGLAEEISLSTEMLQ